MDQEMFRQAYQAINELGCPYEKTILTRNGDCHHAQHFCIAEREGVRCGAAASQTRCAAFLALVRQNARFALKATDQRPSLPHAQAMRVQIGGLRGLHASLDPDQPVPARIPDIDQILDTASLRFGDLATIPFQPLLRQIAAFQGRKRAQDRRT
ncbi:MAG: hypothetical protein WAT23_04980 [Chromatiaceae bacterium]